MKLIAILVLGAITNGFLAYLFAGTESTTWWPEVFTWWLALLAFAQLWAATVLWLLFMKDLKDLLLGEEEELHV